jgi:hypothetical protein
VIAPHAANRLGRTLADDGMAGTPGISRRCPASRMTK